MERRRSYTTLTDVAPLAFGSLKLAEKYVLLTAQDYRLIDTSFPGPLTLVCAIHNRQDRDVLGGILHTDGTIGVRIPDSPVERQISEELERPITTCAIRSDDGAPVRSFDDAVSIVSDRMATSDQRFLLYTIKMTRIRYPDVSTVATVQADGEKLEAPYSVYIIRPGVLEREELEKSLRRVSYREVEDWT